MIRIHKKKAQLSLLILSVTFVFIFAVPSFTYDAFWHENEGIYLPFALLFGGSYLYAFSSYAKAKGYSGIAGILLSFFFLLGLIILVLLKDKTQRPEFAVLKD